MKQFLRDNGFLVLLAAVLLAALIAVGSFLLGGDPLADAVGFITTPFRNGTAAVAEWMEYRYDRAFRYDALEQVNQELRARLAELEELERKYTEAVRENELYKELLGLPQKDEGYELVEASITQRSTSSWERSCTLNRGARDGIEPGDCVVDQYWNFLGVITEVDPTSCIMNFITDAELDLGGHVARVDEDAILEGDFTLMMDGRLKLSYLPDDTEIVAGDQVTTSGLGGVYPQGLMVGTIESMQTEANGLDLYAVVKPAANLEGQRYVFIIKGFDGKN